MRFSGNTNPFARISFRSASNGITSANRQVYGTYSAAIRKVKITVATTEDTFRGGEFAKLTVSYPTATTLTTNDFSSLNAPSFPFFGAGGYVVGSAVLT